MCWFQAAVCYVALAVPSLSFDEPVDQSRRKYLFTLFR
jgi:hypothetical protein